MSGMGARAADGNIAAGGVPERAGAAGDVLPVVLEDVGFAAEGRDLVSGVSLTLGARGDGAVAGADGRAVPKTVLLGANGAGKTTLLRLMHGLLPAAAGRITWGGAAPSVRLRRRQALVTQSPTLLRRSVASNLRHALKSCAAGKESRAERESRLAAVLESVGLGARLHVPARSLSGGEKQRLALARAFVRRPSLLLLDEPTAQLDPAGIADIERLVTEQAAQGTTVLFVTHDPAQARRLAERVLFLDAGRLIADRAADDFFSDPPAAARAFLAQHEFS